MPKTAQFPMTAKVWIVICQTKTCSLLPISSLIYKVSRDIYNTQGKKMKSPEESNIHGNYIMISHL